MDSATLEQIKAKLLQQKEQLQSELQRESSPTPDEVDGRTASFPDYGDHDDENASEVADYATNMQVEENREELLASIEKSLTEIEQGSYGKCQSCGKEIAAERLLANPTAQTCLSCANQA
ncbi:MAG: TraR/DksA C4-type zinc finger protein [Candidatus Nomurabacteria bacterium]|nr:MAG: TraR/DksA C4-type zinc finger protein [Candidatus Nomurabacteria bacterium]